MPSRRSRRTLVVAAAFALVAALVLPSAFVAGDVRPAPSAPVDGPAVEGLDEDEAGADPVAGTDDQGLDAGAGQADQPTVDGRAGLDGNPHGPADAGPRHLTLPTGETVLVHDAGGTPSYEVVSGGPVRVVTANDRTYVLPEGVDLGTYDRSLFEVGALASARSEGSSLPVLLDTDASTSAVDAAGLRNVRRLESAGVIAAELDPERAGETVGRLVDAGVVRRVSLDREVGGSPEVAGSARPPTVPGNHTGEGVTVAVLDTGIDASHPDLAGRVVDRVDLVDGGSEDDDSTTDDEGGDERANDRDGSESAGGADGESADGGGGAGAGGLVRDANGHGTYVAGVLAGSGDGDGTHAGVAPGVDLVDVRVMNDRGSGRASTIVEGIEYAVERDVDVIVLSVGTSIDGSGVLADSVEWATERGVVVVAAAGNAGEPRSIGAPGRPGGAITVGATGDDGRVASFSSRGPTLDGLLKPDLVAPGHQVVGPRSSDSGRVAVDGDGRYTWVTGTSAAAPQVAGAAALLLEAEPDLTVREIEARLASAARPVDGAGAYAQGGGEVDVERALDPDVVVYDSVVDFGLLADDGTVNRTLTVANHDDREHDLRFDVRVRNVDLGVDADGTASLNATELTLSPGERANLALSVDGDTASGAHAGEIRYSVAGEPRSVAFGFVRGGAVTVEKLPLTAGARVDGDALWVLTEEGTHDELLEFENGTASFVAGGGTYLLWSWGTDEPTGTTVFLSERRTFGGPERVVLDEAETVPVGVDVRPIEERYGPLSNLSVTASMSAPYADGAARLSVSDREADSRTVRFSPDPEVGAAATYLLAARPGGSASLDVADVFQLGHGVRGVRGPSVVEVGVGSLETTEHRLHRTTLDETYSVQDRVRIDGVWNQIPRQWFDVGGRTTQRIHRFPSSATYNRAFRGDGWSAYRGSGGDVGGTVDVLSHPMFGLVEAFRVGDGNLTVTGTPFSDGDGTRYDPPGEHTTTVSVDGTVVREERTRGGRSTFEGVSLDPGENLTVRIVGDHPGGYLSTRTLTEVSMPDYDPVEDRFGVDVNRPPVVTDVAVRGTDAANAVQPGEVTAVYEVDAVGPAINPVVWYAAGAPGEPPWRNRSGWERAETRWFGGRLHATFDAEATADTVSLAAEFGDIRGHRTRTMTVDAVHVGRAPDTTTSVLGGRLLAADGTPADNDTVVVAPAGSGTTRYVRTDRDGRFSVELPRDRSYDLTYVRGEPWTASEPTADDRPAWLPLERVRVGDDVDLGNRSLPRAGELVVAVTDERGEPVEGATVRLVQRSGNVSATEVLWTAEDGLARRVGTEEPGIRLAGPIEATVEPRADELYPEQAHRLNVTVSGPRADGPWFANVTVETSPPEAVLAAYGTFEAGDPVFLHARKSEVPAGAAEYRWDLDGDGEVDRVTEEPAVRYVPEEATLRPTLTVVDRAGKTDESTLTLRLDGNETGT